MKRGRYEYLSDVDDDDEEEEEREIYGYVLNPSDAELLNIERPQRWYLNNIDADRWRTYVDDKLLNAFTDPHAKKIRTADLLDLLEEEIHYKHPLWKTDTLQPEGEEYEHFKKVIKKHPTPYRLAAAKGVTYMVISKWCDLLNAHRTNNDIYFASISANELTPDLFDTYDRIALSVEIDTDGGGAGEHAILWLIDNEKEISYILDSSEFVTNNTELSRGILRQLRVLKGTKTWDRYMHNLIVMKTRPYINLFSDEYKSLPIQFMSVYYQTRPLYTGDCAIYVMWFMLWLFFHPTVYIPQPPPMPLHEPMAMRHFIAETLESGQLKIPKKMLPSLYYIGTGRDPPEHVIEKVNAYYDPSIGSGWFKKRVGCKRVSKKKKT